MGQSPGRIPTLSVLTVLPPPAVVPGVGGQLGSVRSLITSGTLLPIILRPAALLPSILPITPPVALLAGGEGVGPSLGMSICSPQWDSHFFPDFVHQPLDPLLPVCPPHYCSPMPASLLALGAAVHMPGMALLKMTFNQGWNYHSDGCKPRNQSRAAGRVRLAGALQPSRRQSSAKASHIKPPQTSEVLKASAPPFIRLTNNT